ncbi:MAG: response regulator [Polyangiaceae bacterium]
MQPASTPATVLIVDDNEEILATTAAYFRARGFTVIASSTPLGVSSLISHHAPNVLILDLMMPALNGDALLKLLRKATATRNVPTVLYSSADEELLYRITKSIEGTEYVQKSDGLPALFRTVEARLRS